MLPRVPEPEFMDDHADSAAYDAMDHSQVNLVFVQDLLAAHYFDPRNAWLALDLGTGTARIPILLCEQHARCKVLAIDAAASMLEIARINVAAAAFEDRIELRNADSKALNLNDPLFDCVISNSLIHHLPDPALAFREIVRVLKPGGRVFVRDLCRPDSAADVEQLVQTHASQEPAGSQQLLRQSLHAALSLDEVRQFVVPLNFSSGSVAMTSDRHWTWSATKPTR